MTSQNLNEIDAYIKECIQIINRLDSNRISISPNMPPYSLFSNNLMDFIERNPSLPMIEVDEIRKNLSINRYSVNSVAIGAIKSALEGIKNKFASQQLILDNSHNNNQLNIANLSDVFIVHGHDDLMKLSVSNFVRKLGFNPIILHEQIDRGRTIIEKFENCSNVAYAIILYSPDDKMETGKMRARQNVVFEHGFFIGKLGRNRVVGLFKDSDCIEIPSDLQGILYKSFNRNWEFDVAKEMKNSGLDIDLNKI